MGANTLIPYLWAATGLVSLVVIVVAIAWAYSHGQFDENIKYQMFDADDDERYGTPQTPTRRRP